MLRTIALLVASCVVACGSSDSSVGSNPGPLVDNTLWAPTDEGEAIFGTRPPDAVCNLEPIDCPEYPWRRCDHRIISRWERSGALELVDLRGV